ncbi:MAG: hypothetical protein AAF986_11035, partial [Pseudomonadota bacterium]
MRQAERLVGGQIGDGVGQVNILDVDRTAGNAQVVGAAQQLACYKFVAPAGFTEAQVLRRAHDLRVARGAVNI